MERLRQRDLRALLEFLSDIYASGGLEVFRVRLIAALPKIIPSEITTFVQFNRRRRMSWMAEPADALSFPDSQRIFEQHMHESPLFSSYQRGEGSAVKTSDFLTRSQFHRLGLYNEFYRRIGAEYHIAKGLPGPPGLVTAVVMLRSRQDFSERDRLLLNLLRPHLNQAYRNAEAVTQMQAELKLVSQVVEKLDRGAIVLTREGRPRLMTTRARRWLAEYFGNASGARNALPEALERWIRHQEGLTAGTEDASAPREPLVVEREGKRLVLRLLSDPDQSFLLLDERLTALQPAGLESLGLSRREAEVLAWVAEGKTNDEIGTILGTSPRTVEKHLEHIFRKLGVETRTAAVTRALAHTSPREP